MQFSQQSRIWIYQAKRELTSLEVSEISTKLQNFVLQWQAHGNELAAGYEIRYNRFIILIVDESIAGATGCSIDKSVKLLQEIDSDYSLDLFNRFNMAHYNEDGEIIDCSRAGFEAKIAAGNINQNTIVFNNTLQHFHQLRDAWEIPYMNSWHSKVFGEPEKA